MAISEELRARIRIQVGDANRIPSHHTLNKPWGWGISRPNSYAVSIHSCITISTLCNTS